VEIEEDEISFGKDYLNKPEIKINIAQKDKLENYDEYYLISINMVVYCRVFERWLQKPGMQLACITSSKSRPQHFVSGESSSYRTPNCNFTWHLK
jgi:hypothetical protein